MEPEDIKPVAWLARRIDWPAGKWEAFKGEFPPDWADGADPLFTKAACDRHVALLREALTALEATLEDSEEVLSRTRMELGTFQLDRQHRMAAELGQHRATAQKLRDALGEQ